MKEAGRAEVRINLGHTITGRGGEGRDKGNNEIKSSKGPDIEDIAELWEYG